MKIKITLNHYDVIKTLINESLPKMKSTVCDALPDEIQVFFVNSLMKGHKHGRLIDPIHIII